MLIYGSAKKKKERSLWTVQTRVSLKTFSVVTHDARIAFVL
jgi:hypothetical protein